MTDARDELAELIEHAILQRDEWTQSESEAAADAILAAGWRAPLPPCNHHGIVHVTFGGKCMRCGEALHEPMTIPEIEAEVRERISAQPVVTADDVLAQIRAESDGENGEWEKIHMCSEGEPFDPDAGE